MSANDDLEGADIWGDANDNSGGGDEPQKPNVPAGSGSASGAAAAAAESEEKEEEIDAETQAMLDETATMSTTELRQRIHLIDNDIRVMKSDIQRIQHESRAQRERIRENIEKVKLNKQLPYLVGNVVEVLEPDAEDGLDEEDGAEADADSQRKIRSAVVRTSTRQVRLSLHVVTFKSHQQTALLHPKNRRYTSPSQV
jgi:ATP-dependent 26S proteasome regulatory subunit